MFIQTPGSGSERPSKIALMDGSYCSLALTLGFIQKSSYGSGVNEVLKGPLLINVKIHNTIMEIFIS